MKFNLVKNNFFIISSFIAISLIIFLYLWWGAGQSYLNKGSGESHALYLSAYNIHDLKSLILQNMSTEYDAFLNPEWYIHHPNLPAKIVSKVLQLIGLNLEWQVGIMLTANILGLGILAYAIGQVSKWGAIFGVLIALTSWSSFHFNASDLVRGPTYIILWLTLSEFLHIYKEGESDHVYKLSALSVLAVLSDWGFAIFLLSVIYCLSILRGWSKKGYSFFKLVAIPSFIAFLCYELFVAWTIGIEDFIYDLARTYFSRLSNIDISQYIFSIKKQTNIINWENLSLTNLNLFGFIRVISYEFNSLIFVFKISLIGFLVFSLIKIVLRYIDVKYITLSAFCIIFNISFDWPFQILIIPWLFLVSTLPKLPFGNSSEVLLTLTFVIFISLLLAAIIFPGYAINFLYIGERSPSPVLTIVGSAAFVQALVVRKRKYDFF